MLVEKRTSFTSAHSIVACPKPAPSENLAPPSVLVVVPDRRLFRAIGRVVHGSGARVVEATSLDVLATANEPFALVICDFDELGGRALDAIQEALGSRVARGPRAHAPPILLMSERSELDPVFSPLFAGPFFNVIAKVAKDGSFSAPDLLVTIRKLLDRDVFGVEKYVHWGSMMSRVPVVSSSDVPMALQCFESFMGALDVPRLRMSELVTVAEELVTNALFDAPMTALGDRFNAHKHRREEVVLPAGREAELSFASDGRILAVAVRDAYGSLDPSSVFRGLQRCAARGDDQVRQGSDGGAGIGLYMVYEYVDHLVINLRAGEATEVIGLVELGLRQRDRRVSGKSINVFSAMPRASVA